METCFCSFLIRIFCNAVLSTHAIAVYASSAHMCIVTNGVQQLCPLGLLRKKAQAVSPRYAQSKAQINYPQIISYIERCTCRCYGARLVEERKNNSYLV